MYGWGYVWMGTIHIYIWIYKSNVPPCILVRIFESADPDSEYDEKFNLFSVKK